MCRGICACTMGISMVAHDHYDEGVHKEMYKRGRFGFSQLLIGKLTVARIRKNKSVEMAKQPSAAELQHNYEGVKYDFIFPAESLEKCKNFEFDESDVIVVGYPKTGKRLIPEVII